MIKSIIKKMWDFIKRVIKQVVKEIKELGWFWGIIAVLIAVAIFYAPTIVSFILYIITDKSGFLKFAGGYAMWWFLPMGSPATQVYLVILLFVIKIINKLRRKK